MKLVRMRSGHGDVLLAEGDPEVAEDEDRLIAEFRRQLDAGMWAAVPSAVLGCRDAGHVRGRGPAVRRGARRRREGQRPFGWRLRRVRTSGRNPRDAYLVYPSRPLVAYDTETGELLAEYCVGFDDEGERLPPADDVLAKWMSLRGLEYDLIAEANLNRPGHQVDPDHARRDIERLRALGA